MKWIHSIPFKHDDFFDILTAFIETKQEAMISFKINNIIYLSSSNNFDDFPRETQDAADNIILWQKSD